MAKSPASRLPTLNDIRIATSFLTRLPGFLHRKIDSDQAGQVIEQRLRQREQSFLHIVREFVFGYTASPYLKLMQNAGLELGDVEALVHREGLENALRELLKAGVYLKVDEFKGRSDAVRGSQSIETGPLQLRNPRSQFHIPVHSGGSRTGQGTPVVIDLAYVADCAVNICRILHLHGGDRWLKSTWEVPGGGSLFRLLKMSRFGRPPEKWFSQLDPASPELHPRYRFSGLALRWMSRAAGVPMPAAEYAPLQDPSPIARWMTSSLAEGHTPFLFTFPSSAVRLCRTAVERGLDISGSSIMVSGEPITAARTATIESAGARLLPRYGTIETGPIAYCCMNRSEPDELHVQEDLHALIQAADQGPELEMPAASLFITCLRASAPFVMINTSMGDRAEMVSGGCGCPLESYWPKRIKAIRSFEKLTGAGVNFPDSHLIGILEEVLPKRFGGSHTDYQLVEKESEKGVPELHLLIHPRLGDVDEDEVKKAFLEGLGAESDASAVMQLTWKQANILNIVRQTPESTASGKIMHLHVTPQGKGQA